MKISDGYLLDPYIDFSEKFITIFAVVFEWCWKRLEMKHFGGIINYNLTELLF